MVNSTLLQILASREDLSDYLFHFTRGKKAFETLEKILNDGKLKDIYERGCLCFTEAPLTTLYNMFQIFERYDNPMYAPYGIGLKKSRFTLKDVDLSFMGQKRILKHFLSSFSGGVKNICQTQKTTLG